MFQIWLLSPFLAFWSYSKKAHQHQGCDWLHESPLQSILLVGGEHVLCWDEDVWFSFLLLDGFIFEVDYFFANRLGCLPSRPSSLYLL
jgi:hypothetical protein